MFAERQTWECPSMTPYVTRHPLRFFRENLVPFVFTGLILLGFYQATRWITSSPNLVKNRSVNTYYIGKRIYRIPVSYLYLPGYSSDSGLFGETWFFDVLLNPEADKPTLMALWPSMQGAYLPRDIGVRGPLPLEDEERLRGAVSIEFELASKTLSMTQILKNQMSVGEGLFPLGDVVNGLHHLAPKRPFTDQPADPYPELLTDNLSNPTIIIAYGDGPIEIGPTMFYIADGLSFSVSFKRDLLSNFAEVKSKATDLVLGFSSSK
jgi:hypothetical protein